MTTESPSALESKVPRTRFVDVLSRTKSFDHRWVGHRTLNRLGLNVLRIAAANVFTRLRRLQSGSLRGPARLGDMRRSGVAVIEDFLPTRRFRDLREEARAHVAASIRAHPPPLSGTEGFGLKQPFAGGFDRLDGSTLNRYLEISEERTPLAAALATDPELAELCRWAYSYRHRPEKLSIYLTVQGDEADHHDIQKDLHRDTFHSAVKLWYFLEPVGEHDGPFEYVLGSHRTNWRRYLWEHRRAKRAPTLDRESRNGSFRIDAAELDQLCLAPPRRFPVPENTLVIADVRGFHCRGQGLPGSRRLAVFATLRPHPFSPLPR